MKRGPRSARGQQVLWNHISRELAALAKAERENREADPELWPCPDGERCIDAECKRLKAEMDARRII